MGQLYPRFVEFQITGNITTMVGVCYLKLLTITDYVSHIVQQVIIYLFLT